MAKIGRNDPCLCGSGQKYKNCHMAADEARAAELRAIRQAPDKLIPRLIEALGDYADATPAALSRFWQEKYTIDQASGLDDLEERGSERFMTWMLFDYALGDGTPLAQIAADPDREWSPAERTLLDGWREVRLQP